MTPATPAPECVTCGQKLLGTNGYGRALWHAAILRDTPREVWVGYQDAGISLLDAVIMEASYAG